MTYAGMAAIAVVHETDSSNLSRGVQHWRSYANRRRLDPRRIRGAVLEPNQWDQAHLWR